MGSAPREPVNSGSKTRRSCERTERGHRPSYAVAADLLRQLGYNLQANRKTKEGTDHLDAAWQHVRAELDDNAYPSGIEMSNRHRRAFGVGFAAPPG